MALPTSSASNVIVGAVGYFYMEERASSGAALGTPDTAHKVSLIGPAKLSREPASSSTTEIKAKTNAYGQEITAQIAYNAAAAASNSAAVWNITFNLKESGVDHLDFYESVKGKYFVICIPLGLRNDKNVEFFGFVQIEDGGDLNFDPDKESEVTVTAKTITNSVEITAATITDSLVGNGTSVIGTIAQYKGYKFMATTPA